MKNRFQFYEVVVVVGGDDKIESVVGKEGTILGLAQDDESRRWSYAVSMASTGEVWNFDEHQLESTGKHQDRCGFYSGDVVKVKVDPKTRRGVSASMIAPGPNTPGLD